MLKLLIFLFLFSCAKNSVNQKTPLPFSINEIKPTKLSALTRQNLIHLAQVYELSPFIFNKSITIESSESFDFKNSILISEKFAENPDQLLVHFLDQQIRWMILNSKNKINPLRSEFSKIFFSKKRFGRMPISAEEVISNFYLKQSLTYLLGNSSGEEQFKIYLKRRKKIIIDLFILKNKEQLKQLLKNHKMLPAFVN